MSKSMVEKMKEMGVIDSRDDAIYEYGLEILKLKFIAACIAGIIAIFLDTEVFLIYMLVILIPIRRYAGGVHARSKYLCMGITELLLLGAELVYKFIEINFGVMIACMVLGIVMVIIKSPSNSPNHPLTCEQIRKYRRISIGLCIISVIVFTVVYINNYIIGQYAISLAYLIEFILLFVDLK